MHRALGLSDDEAARISEILGRSPNHLELAMYGVMWSEHCSYKSSRIHLRRLPSEAAHVLVGPGEGAGVIDAGDGIAVAIRIESHNHPSAIEPYEGAATGVGGIIRDVFTMGARPIAVMDPLRFGPLDDATTRWIFEGVVNGISGYGNAVGVPTVGGETVFDPTYAENPLVNVFCLGVLPTGRLVKGRASGAGNLAVLIGSSTGRDGIGGVSMASEGFTDDEAQQAKRPSVQVGDPFEEKRLIEACLALLDEELVIGVQDLGGAGLTCATSEMAAKGMVGMDVNVAVVPRREPGMAPYEVMTSESQERMLAVVEPRNLERALAVCRRWEVAATVVGRVTATGRLRILDGWDGEVLADVPASTLGEDESPRYDRPRRRPDDLDRLAARDLDRQLAPPDDAGRDLCALLVDPAWVYRQYDHQLFLNTVEPPGGDAAVLRLKAPGLPPSRKGLAVSTDGNSRWCALEPRLGTAMVVAESALNVACAGARSVALVDCLNFGNPEHPAVMWQFAEAIDGMSEACRVLDLPVVGGNVSFYNESRGRDIDPTPVVATLGLIESLERRPPGARLVDGTVIVALAGGGDTGGPTLSGSRWAAEVAGEIGGRLPRLDLVAHVDLCEVVRTLVAEDVVAGLHDVSDGGLGLCLAEMAVRAGVGFVLDDGAVADHIALFGESPSRVVVCVPEDGIGEVEHRAARRGVVASRIGLAGGDRLVIPGLVDLSLANATDAWHNAIPRALHPS